MHADFTMFAQIHTNANLTVHNGTTGAVVAWTKLLPSNIDLTAVPALQVRRGVREVAWVDLT